jgi:hypothetical protein
MHARVPRGQLGVRAAISRGAPRTPYGLERCGERNEEFGDENDGVRFPSSLVLCFRARVTRVLTLHVYVPLVQWMDGLPADEINGAIKLIIQAKGHLNCSNEHTKLALCWSRNMS